MVKRQSIIFVLTSVLALLCACIQNQGIPAVNTTTTVHLVSTTPGTTLSAAGENVSEIVIGEYETNYANIEYAGNLGGGPAYIVAKGAKKLILYQSKEIGGSYDQALMPALVGGRLFYAGVKDNKYYAVYDGKEIGGGFFRIWSPGEHLGGPVYVAEELGRSILVDKGEELGGDYSYVWSYALVGDKIAYLASRINETYVPSGRINSLTSENRRDVPPAGVKAIIRLDGVEHGRKYDTVLYPLGVEGKLAYVVLEDGKSFLVYDGLEGEFFDEIYEPLLYDGKVAFLAERNGSGLLVYDGKVAAEHYRVDGESLAEIDGKLAYRASDADMQKGGYFMVYDGKEVGREYDSVISFTASGGKQAYLAEKDQSRFVVYDGRVIKHGYDYVDAASLAFYDGKLTFTARRDGTWYIIREE